MNDILDSEGVIKVEREPSVFEIMCRIVGFPMIVFALAIVVMIWYPPWLVKKSIQKWLRNKSQTQKARNKFRLYNDTPKLL